MQTETDKKLHINADVVDIACYSSFEEAGLTKDQWDEFVERVGADLYVSYDWCTTWWKHFGWGRKLEIYIARAEGKIVAILPMFREKIRWGLIALWVVRLVGCDHLTTVCNLAVDSEWISVIVPALISQLNQNGKWDVIHLGELAGYCEIAGAFAQELKKCKGVGKVIFGDNDYPHMVCEVKSDYENYIAFLSKKERRNIRYEYRSFEENAVVSYHSPESQEELDKSMDRLVDLHTKQWNQRGRLGHFGEWPGAESFHREIGNKLFKSGRLVLDEIYRNNELVVSEFGGFFDSRYHWLVNARVPDIVGTRIGFCAVLKHVIAHGVKQIDTLPGYYDYKRRLGAGILGVKNITVVNGRFSSRLRFRVMQGLTWFIGMLYFRLWFWHLAPWIRSKWPNLLRNGVSAGFIRSRFLLMTTGSSFAAIGSDEKAPNTESVDEN